MGVNCRGDIEYPMLLCPLPFINPPTKRYGKRRRQGIVSNGDRKDNKERTVKGQLALTNYSSSCLLIVENILFCVLE